ncbi:SRPBCC family protein [Sabulibacter ruber]|uniref:SRPBCC family protein n=1 Tax=Sabulibacter ruber TaxID=2811901 RepID=UPI001F602911|nr:SRPBCC family protein [Sabulibacter ruber]
MAQTIETLPTPQLEELVITRTFDAPAAAIWQAWTNPDYLVQWWGPKGFTSPVCYVDLRVGGEYLFCMRSSEGQDYWSKGVYKEIQEPVRLVATDCFSDAQGNTISPADAGLPGDWADELEVTLTLEEQNGKTLFTLQHKGLPNGEMREMTKAGWNESLDKLQEVLALEVSSPESSSIGQDFEITCVLDAPKELVFKAWTEADRLNQWYGPQGFTLGVGKLELKPGGIFLYSMQAGNGPKLWGKFVFQEIAAPDQLVYVNSFSDEEATTTRAPFSETWPLEMWNLLTLTEENGKTRLHLRSRPHNASPEEKATFEAGFTSMQKGFAGTLEQLETYLKKAQE